MLPAQQQPETALAPGSSALLEAQDDPTINVDSFGTASTALGIAAKKARK